MSMFMDLVKQGKAGSVPRMSLAKKLNLAMGDILSHGSKWPFTCRFVAKDNETAYLKVTMADGSEPRRAVVISDDGGPQIICFLHPNMKGSDAWKLIHGSEADVATLVNDEAMEEARFDRAPATVATPFPEVNAAHYDVVYWATAFYPCDEKHE